MYSLIWSFGGVLNETNKLLFQRHLKDTFKDTLVMDTGTLWEYRLQMEDEYTFQHCTGGLKNNNDGGKDELYVCTSRTAATSELVKLLIGAGVSVVIDGHCGSGKTSFVLNCMDDSLSLLRLLMNEDYTTHDVWTQLQERLTWHSGTTYIPVGTDTLVAMIDDVHLTQVQLYYQIYMSIYTL